MTTGHSRGSTDRTTNHVFLGDSHIEEDLSLLLSFGEGPDRLMSGFLHEATHHWCFHSPVGVTLAVLQMLIHRAALLIANGTGRNLVPELASSINRYETAIAFLHSIEIAAAFFFRPQIVPTTADSSIFVTVWRQAALRRFRLLPQTLDRKVDVLGLPLICGNDPYLPGYLMVRELWLNGVRHYWDFASETDLFLVNLRSYLHDDFGLVAILLDSSTDEITGAQAVMDRILTRLKQFAYLSAANVRKFGAAVASEDEDDRQSCILRAIGLDDRDIRRGHSMLRAELRAYVTPPTSSLDGFLKSHERDVLLGRQLLSLGSWPVEDGVSSGRYKVRQAGTVVRESTCIPGITDGSGEGWIEVIQWIPRRQRLCAIVRNGTLIAVESTLVPDATADKEEFAELVESRHPVIEQIAWLDTITEDFVEATWASVAVSLIRKQLVKIVDDAYLPMALGRVPDEQRHRTMDVMRRAGFYEPLKYDRYTIAGLAALGLSCSALGAQEGFAESHMGRMGLNFCRTIAAAESLHAEYGVGRVWRENRCILPSDRALCRARTITPLSNQDIEADETFAALKSSHLDCSRY